MDEPIKPQVLSSFAIPQSAIPSDKKKLGDVQNCEVPKESWKSNNWETNDRLIGLF
jgi:hypothetical protein